MTASATRMERVFGDFPYVLRTPLEGMAQDGVRVRNIVLAEHRAWVAPDQQYSFPIRSEDPFFDGLYERFLQLCRARFEPFTLHPASRRTCFAYVQTDRVGASVWHDHLATSTINGVYYLTAPDPSGQLWFMFRETLVKATPQEGWLYLFPRWLLHKPAPQRSPFPRISLNVELISRECPIDSDGGARW